jgi:excisionase family DNA binding protein
VNAPLLVLLLAAGLSGLGYGWNRWGQARRTQLWERSASMLQTRAQHAGWTYDSDPAPVGGRDEQHAKPVSRAAGSDAGESLARHRVADSGQFAGSAEGTGVATAPVSAHSANGSSVPASSEAQLHIVDSTNHAAKMAPAGEAPALLMPRPAGREESAPDAAHGRPPEWMTVQEICYETRLSEAFVRKQLRSSALPFTIFGSRVRVRRSDYEAWSVEQTHSAVGGGRRHGTG